jgi:alkyl sulfatase BDS1-like metallo-beta-lactamase superfamily hydrolase
MFDGFGGGLGDIDDPIAVKVHWNNRGYIGSLSSTAAAVIAQKRGPDPVGR